MLPRLPIIALAAALLAVTVARAQSVDDARQRALGQHLSRECVTCHRIDGTDNGIPAIIGWRAEDFVETLGYYKSGQRPNPAMVSVAQSLADDEVRALAAYFGALPPAKRQPAGPKKTK